MWPWNYPVLDSVVGRLLHVDNCVISVKTPRLARLRTSSVHRPHLPTDRSVARPVEPVVSVGPVELSVTPVCVCVCVCLSVCPESVLWQNGWTDPDAIWGGELGWLRYGHIRWGWWSSKGRGSFGGEFGASHCNQWGLCNVLCSNYFEDLFVLMFVFIFFVYSCNVVNNYVFFFSTFCLAGKMTQ